MIFKTKICFFIILLACFFQKAEAQSVNFKILNPKKIYSLKDKLKLSIENVTNKPLYYLIGKEFYEYPNWIEYLFDIKNVPLKDVDEEVGRYVIIPARTFKIITVDLSKTTSVPKTKHGISMRNRFCLRYHHINALIRQDNPKLVTVEFAENW